MRPASSKPVGPAPPEGSLDAERQRFSSLLRGARRVVALTGAGVSAESGVPTFRGPGGLWQSHRPEDLATPEAFRREPRLVWEWYDWRRGLVAAARPNPAHRWLACYEETHPDFVLATQNVDGLHNAAGSRRVLELHGSLWRLRCTECAAEAEDRRVPLPVLPPLCAACGGLLRPGVVWFGEALPEVVLAEAASAVRACDLLLVLGTSAVVYPVAALPDLLPSGAALIEINPDETPLSARAALAVRAPAGRFLEPLLT